jgi:hypothetical protein
MATITIHDLVEENPGVLVDTDLERVVGGLTGTVAQAPMYFSTSTYTSLTSMQSLQQPLTPKLPLLGGSLVTYPALSGVRG